MSESLEPGEPSAESHVLIGKALGESLTDSEFSKLQELLRTDPRVFQLYNDYANLDAGLVSLKQTSAFCQKVVADEPIVRSREELRSSKKTAKIRGRSIKAIEIERLFPLRTAAAVLMLGLSLGCGVGILAATLGYPNPAPTFFPLPWEWRVDNTVAAKIESTHDIAWQKRLTPDTLPTRGVRAGEQVRIDSGLVQLAYRSGSGVIIQGPAVFEVRSDRCGKLFSGRMSVTTTYDVAPFHVETATGRLQVVAGHVGIDAGDSASDRTVSIQMISDVGAGVAMAKYVSTSGETTELELGDALRVSPEGLESKVAPTATAFDFPQHLPPANREEFVGDTIWLGNLFDDSLTASLTEAMLSDEYQAAAEPVDLGVAAVIDGGLDIDVNLAEDGVLFNFMSVGGGSDKVTGLPANDTYRSAVGIPIRTTGKPFSINIEEDYFAVHPKVEEGIGMSSNGLLTFDLQELRDAGQLNGIEMRFISDRAGINDRELPFRDSMANAHANLIVIVSTEDEVISAYLNGELVEVVQRGAVFSLDVDAERAARGVRQDKSFLALNIPIPAKARFLTLVSTQIEHVNHDHTVFSGARLELRSKRQD